MDGGRHAKPLSNRIAPAAVRQRCWVSHGYAFVCNDSTISCDLRLCTVLGRPNFYKYKILTDTLSKCLSNLRYYSIHAKMSCMRSSSCKDCHLFETLSLIAMIVTAVMCLLLHFNGKNYREFLESYLRSKHIFSVNQFT